MGELSPILRNVEDNGLLFWCPGCNMAHYVPVGNGTGPRWGWNGSADKPTFTPSILIRTGHYVPSHQGEECWCSYNIEHPEEEDPYVCSICHSFVTDGMIQFLGDCTHHLANQTVDLPVWPT